MGHVREYIRVPENQRRPQYNVLETRKNEVGRVPQEASFKELGEEIITFKDLRK